MKEQTKYINSNIDEARQTHSGLDPVLWERLDDLLWDSLGCRDLRPFRINRHGDKVGVWWDYDKTSVWAMFSPHTTDWEWSATTSKSNGNDMDGDTTYTVTYKHTGKCSFTYKDTPHYFFPDEVEELVSVPDVFSKEYEPRLGRANWTLVWETNKYDGMLSGYINIGGKMYYADMVEETYHQRKRMYAVYELSMLERVRAHIGHQWWKFTLDHRSLFNMRVKWSRFRDNMFPKTRVDYERQRNKFRETHQVKYYFES